MLLASSTLVFHPCRLRSWICIRAQNDSIVALSTAAPTFPHRWHQAAFEDALTEEPGGELVGLRDPNGGPRLTQDAGW